MYEATIGRFRAAAILSVLLGILFFVLGGFGTWLISEQIDTFPSSWSMLRQLLLSLTC